VVSGEWGVGSVLFLLIKPYSMLALLHKKLEVYQLAIAVVQETYKITAGYPKEERYVLVTQLRRSAISICSNIAEGSARKSSTEKRRFYEIARSSLVELDTQFEISIILGYLTEPDSKKINQELESIFRMLSKMIENLEIKVQHPH
jgi:four helix bundle protein